MSFDKLQALKTNPKIRCGNEMLYGVVVTTSNIANVREPLESVYMPIKANYQLREIKKTAVVPTGVKRKVWIKPKVTPVGTKPISSFFKGESV